MKTITQNSTGSNYMQPANVHDKINLRDRLSCRIPLVLMMTINKEAFLYKTRFGVSYAIRNIISGDLNYIKTF